MRLYEIMSEPKYKNMVTVILEGVNSEEEYCTVEYIFTKEKFDSQVAEDLVELLKACLKSNGDFSEFENESFDIKFTSASDCEEINAYEVNYYDKDGVVHSIVMNF